MLRNDEDSIQASIVEYLRLVLPDCIVFSIPNGGFRTPKEAAKLKWTGVLAGVPDLAIVAPGGRIFFIEVKSAIGKLSPEQVAMYTWFIDAGVPYAVARSVDDVRLALDHWRLETREAA